MSKLGQIIRIGIASTIAVGTLTAMFIYMGGSDLRLDSGMFNLEDRLQDPATSVPPTTDEPETEQEPSTDEKKESGLPKTAKELATEWEKPDIALFITGQQSGYIEPCGCAGLDQQKGGLIRRHVAQKTIKDRGWDVVSIDSGNQIRRFGQQPMIKLGKTYEALCKTMDYQVIGFGVDDLRLGTIDLVQTMFNAQGNANPFTCANLMICDDKQLTSGFRVIERNKKRIGITCVLGDEYVVKLKNQKDLKFASMQKAMQQIIPRMQKQNCDLLVLMAQTSEKNCKQLAQMFPVFDIMIYGGAGDPTLLPEQVTVGNHTTHLVQTGTKGQYAGVIGFYTQDNANVLKYRRVPLDHSFEDRKSPEIKDMFLQYQNELKMLYENGRNEDIRPRVHPSGHVFVGSEACFECHDEEFEIWEDGADGDGGPHFRATLDLTEPGERTWVQRHYDPECLSCHVTGWNPQEYYPYKTGFIDLKKDKKLHANGCENCHGPGSAHVEAERNKRDNDAKEVQDRRKALALEMRLTIKQAKEAACAVCHDIDNSPDFAKDGAFEEYWKKIEH